MARSAKIKWYWWALAAVAALWLWSKRTAAAAAAALQGDAGLPPVGADRTVTFIGKDAKGGTVKLQLNYNNTSDGKGIGLGDKQATAHFSWTELGLRGPPAVTDPDFSKAMRLAARLEFFRSAYASLLAASAAGSGKKPAVYVNSVETADGPAWYALVDTSLQMPVAAEVDKMQDKFGQGFRFMSVKQNTGAPGYLVDAAP